MSLKTFIIALSILFCSLTAVAQTKSESADSLTKKVDSVFARFDKPDSPGCSLAVIKDSQIIYKRGYGMSNLEYDIPISPNSIFHVASISKEFTAMSILLLAQQGKLSLDDDIRKYVSEVPDFGEKITIRHLIHHTSGLRDQWSLLDLAGWREDDVITEGDILNLISRQKALNFKPGEEHLYSNTGYTLLAVIVKRVSGQSLRDYADANIFKPLGMTNTHFHDDHTMIVKGRTSAYKPKKEGGFKISIPVFDTYGATSLFTTVGDMAKWDQNFVDKKVGGEAVNAQMLTPGVLNSGKKLGYASGLSIAEYKGLKTVGHGGADAGYRADFVRFPEQQFSFVCLCNISNANPGLLTRQVAEVYLADKMKQDPPAPKKTESGSTVEKPTKEELASKAGLYTERVTKTVVRLEMREGKLTVAMGNGYPLEPIAKDKFEVTEAGMTVSFEGNQNGHPQRMLAQEKGQKEPDVFDYTEPQDAPAAAQVAEYAGSYYSEELDVRYVIQITNGKVVLRRKKTADVMFTLKAPDEYTSPDFGTIKFLRDSNKSVSGFEVSTGRVRRLSFSRESRDGAK